MSQADQYVRFMRQKFANNPNAQYMLSDTALPPPMVGGYISLSQLRRELHVGYHTALRILERENIPLHRTPAGSSRSHCFIDFEFLPRLKAWYGTPEARRLRKLKSCIRKRAEPLPYTCPYCGKTGRQWRNGTTTAGNRGVLCGHCKKHYTHNNTRRPPLQATCRHCGSTTKQYRAGVNSAGNLGVRCGQCHKFYTIQGNLDPVEPKPEQQQAAPEPIFRTHWELW